MRRLHLAFAVIALGCTQPEAPVHSTAPAIASSSASSASSASAPAISASVAVPVPTVEEPPISSATPGPAYVLVDHSGVLQITESGATTVFPFLKEDSLLFTEIAVSPTGRLW